MPGQERIDSLIDIPAVKKEFDTLKGFLEELGITIAASGKGDGFRAMAESFSKAKQGVKDLDDQIKKLQDTTANVTEQQKVLDKTVAEAAVNKQNYNKELKTAAQLQAAESNSINQARASIAALTQERNKLNLATEQGQARAKEINADIDKNNQLIQENSDKIAKRKINIGNYAESLSFLGKELENVNAKLANYNRTEAGAGPAGRSGGDTSKPRQDPEEYNKLVQQQTALNTVVTQQTAGFTSLTQEIRMNERALQTLRGAGLQDTEAFKTLQTQTTKTRQEFNEFAKSEKLLSSAAPALTGLTIAAKGLAGAYAIGAGAAAIFGDEEGKIDKEVQKLVAIMTVLQGLQEAHELLMQKDAIGTALAGAAQKAYAIVVGESTGALRIFKIAAAATGIGLLVIGILALVNQFSKANNEAKYLETGLNSLKGVNQNTKDSLKELGDTVEKIAEGTITDLESQVKGLNDELKFTPSTVDKSTAAIQLLGNEVDRIAKQREGLNDLGKKTLKESFIDIASALGLADDRLAKAQENLDKVKELAAKRDALLAREALQKDRDSAVTLFQNNAILEAKINQDKNNAILADDKTSFADRRAALADNLKQEEAITYQELNKSLIAAGADRVKRKEAEDAFRLKNIQDETAYNTTIRKLNEDEAQRRIKAINDSTNSERQAHDILNQEIIDDDKADQNSRLTALSEFLHMRISEIIRAADIEKSTGYKTAEEIAAIEAKKQLELAQLAKEGSDKYNAIVKQAGAVEQILRENIAKDIVASIEDIEKQLYDRLKKEAEEKLAEEKQIWTQSIKTAEEVGNTIFSIIDSGFKRQIDAIQGLQDAYDSSHDKQVQQVQDSTLSEQDKANKLKVLAAEKQAQDIVFDLKKKEIQRKQAKIQKDESIAQIIASTAVNVVKVFPNPVLIALAIAIGAAQLARVIATPLPKYEHGTESAKGGLSLVSERGRELAIEPGGKTYFTPDIPTIMNVKEGTKIIPHNSLADIDELMRSSRNYGLVTGKANRVEERNNDHMILWQTDQLKKAFKATKFVLREKNDFDAYSNSDYIRKQVKS